MRPGIRSVLLLLLVVLAAGCQSGRFASGAAERPEHEQKEALAARIERSLASAAGYLVSKQSEDGAWRASIYGYMKDGLSLSPHILWALQGLARPGLETRRTVDRGAGYLASLVGPDGTIAPDVSLVYPIYSAAEAARLLASFPEHERARSAFLALLREHQLTEELGWRPEDLEYGGWSYARQPPQRPLPGRQRGPWAFSNLSATVYALAALREAGEGNGDQVCGPAMVFIQRCQNYGDQASEREERFDDGGFFFSPAEPLRNKAGAAGRDRSDQERFHSYGSATADGVRALLACGAGREDARVAAGRRWLMRNFSAEENPGYFEPEKEDLRNATYFYYCMALADVLAQLGDRELETTAGRVDWAAALAEALLERQREDGSWANGYSDAREDDPLVATPLAVFALRVCQRVMAESGPEAGAGGAD